MALNTRRIPMLPPFHPAMVGVTPARHFATQVIAVAGGTRSTLLSCPNLPAPAGADVIDVVSAADMEAAVMPRADEHDVIVMAAAVADFRPAVVANYKIKKDA